MELGRRLLGSPVFLIGCARSGTSILGEALAAQERVAYLFEASRIWNELVPPRGDHRLEAADATAEVAPTIYHALADARQELAGDLFVEKNPKHVIRIPFLRALFPAARFVHIIRDGRDCVASLMFRNRGSTWGHLEIPGWQDLLARYPKENHIRCAHQWRFAVETARADAAALDRDAYLEVRYEALVSHPAATVGSALRFMGLDTTHDVTKFLAKIQNETAGSYHAKKQVRHYVENHKLRVGRYAENLSAAQLRDVTDVCGDLLATLGYE